MDAKHIAERHVIERYLAGQLTDPEAEAFEAYIEAHPEVIKDIDLVSRMKCGLAALHDRRELAAVVQARPRAWKPAVIAASVAALALALFLWVVPHGGGSRALLASAAGDLTDNRRVALPVLAHLDVVRTRGDTDNVLAVPSLDPNVDSTVEFSIDMRAPKPGEHHSVELLRINGGALDSLGKLSNVASQPDGSLRIYVRGSALATGNYLLRAQAEGGEPVEFIVRARSAAH
jgi:hypothetical protein